MRILASKHFNKKTAHEYSKMYNVKKNYIKYPINNLRLNIIKKLLLKYKPKKIIDAGCGSGMPLIQIKKWDLTLLDMINH